MDSKFKGQGTLGKEEWDQLLGHCRAVSDLPCVLFSEELIKTYPDAKVILTEPPKGFDRWYQSCIDTIVRMKDDWTRDIWALTNHEASITRHTFFRAFDTFWDGDFKKHARRRYDEHYAMVRQLVLAERLLEYNVVQGWEPLCAFLERPVPEDGFPSGNDPQNFFHRFAVADARRRKESMWTIAKVVGAMGAVALLAYGA